MPKPRAISYPAFANAYRANEFRELRWHEDDRLGSCIRITMPHETSDLIVAREPTSEGMRYEVFAADSLNKTPDMANYSPDLVKLVTLLENDQNRFSHTGLTPGLLYMLVERVFTNALIMPSRRATDVQRVPGRVAQTPPSSPAHARVQ